jgi:hypothetical protein
LVKRDGRRRLGWGRGVHRQRFDHSAVWVWWRRGKLFLARHQSRVVQRLDHLGHAFHTLARIRLKHPAQQGLNRRVNTFEIWHGGAL